MSTKKPRLSVTFPDQLLWDTVYRDAKLNIRSMSDQIIWALVKVYSEREKDAELFTPTRLREAQRSKAPIFETPSLPHSERPSKSRESQGQERS